ncbi:hypothetical protein KIH87_04485 [Paraneptunicella aestuarii]|uniref:hypothetical protein n=1 Tax=Paraneptunicella aestuarii TaxID=2831148 RepID=UPI001E3FF0ED|nr:hypothetical protein [Paraneptunicella aestuarii]UAA39621.1 hypothetical protein KIH87_04485 [Paraneptunicella aestuarii]
MPKWYDNFNQGDLIYGRNETVSARQRELTANKQGFSGANAPANYINPITERTPNAATGPQANLRQTKATDHASTTAHINTFNSGGKRERHYLNLHNMDRIINREQNATERAKKEQMKWGGTSKMGVISAHENNKRIFYETKGITPESIFNPQHEHYNSVTSKEMRFIYKHQQHLGNTVQWMNDGQLTNSPFGTDAFKNAPGRSDYDKKQQQKKDKGHYSQRLVNGQVDYSKARSTPKLFRK